MPQIFHRSTKTFSKLSIFGAVFVLAALAIVIDSLIPSHSFYLPEPKPQNAQLFFSLYFAMTGMMQCTTLSVSAYLLFSLCKPRAGGSLLNIILRWK
jgi:hypothetical protein